MGAIVQRSSRAELPWQQRHMGTWTGTVAYYALPNGLLAVKGLASAKGLNAIVMTMMGSQAAGQGIDRYRAEELAEGRTPNPWRAMAVGIGYAAAEILTERMSEKIRSGASRPTELPRSPRSSCRGTLALRPNTS